jgi:RES domain
VNTAVSRVVWKRAYRILAARYPPIDLFERLTPDPVVWEALIALEQKVNPRVRDQIGEISLVPKSERVTGPGASWVMAAFTHVNPSGSRFSDGSYGVYYAAKELRTAIDETAFHFARFARDAADPVRNEDMRVLVSGIRGNFSDVETLSKQKRQAVLSKDLAYKESQAWARKVREEGSDGIVFPSVRREGTETALCIAAFRPKVIQQVKDERRLRYHWNGERISKYFDYTLERWVQLAC